MTTPCVQAIDWSAASPAPPCADVYLTGLVDCATMDTLLTIASAEVGSQVLRRAQIFFCEHPPTMTLGCDCQSEPLPIPLSELKSRGIPVVSVHRGGKAILHSPGQLCAYITTSLTRIGCDASEFRRLLERAAVMTCEDFQLVAHRQDGRCGVMGRKGLLCESAVRESNSIAQGMLFLNVLEPSVDDFDVRKPPGQPPLSSINSERPAPVPMPAVRTSLMRHLCDLLQLPTWNIHTRHPALKRSLRKIDEQPSDH